MIIPNFVTDTNQVPLSDLDPGDAFRFTEESAAFLSRAGWPLTPQFICTNVYMRSKQPGVGMSLVGAMNLANGELCGCGEGSMMVFRGCIRPA